MSFRIKIVIPDLLKELNLLLNRFKHHSLKGIEQRKIHKFEANEATKYLAKQL